MKRCMEKRMVYNYRTDDKTLPRQPFWTNTSVWKQPEENLIWKPYSVSDAGHNNMVTTATLLLSLSQYFTGVR